MHIKFLRHGQGSAHGAVSYLLDSHDHRGAARAEVTVLRGDPAMVANVADSSRHQWRYTSGVIAWSAGDQPTLAQIEQIIDEWETAAFAGLTPDQYATCAVLHRDDDGTPHIHTLTARVELSSGKALNIAPPGHERLFDPLRDAWNHAEGWARPDDPDRARRVQPGRESHWDRADHHPMRRADINAYIEDLVTRGRVTNADEVRAILADIGEITRAGASYVSVRPEGAKRPIRLQGDVFRKDWHIDQTIERERRQAQSALAGNAGRVNPEAAERARERLAQAVERRREYHQARYPRSAHNGAERANEPETADRSADQRRDTGYPAERALHDRVGDPAIKAAGAAAERIREAGERAIRTATALADSAERLADSAESAAERERRASPGDAQRAGANAA
ncbi:MAG: relaxase/mobilization nuclease domain-containing protein, partial [Halomonas sp.]